MSLSKFAKYMKINSTVKSAGMRNRGMVLPKEGQFQPRLVCMKQSEITSEFFRDLSGTGKGRK